jgi:DNA helicase-2/ATP-dependent DNA helicase PcrA
MDRYAVIGPPGTGKTTYLKRQVERAAREFGPHEVMVCSLTRAAAAEVRGRDLPIPEDRVGTLHSFAYRALGCPTIAEARLKDWNDHKPLMRLSSSMGVRSPEEERDAERDAADDDGPGDERYEMMQLYRQARTPEELWRPTVREFAQAWRAWCDEAGHLDFTGLIETALEQVDDAPGRPLTLFVDEAQDMSRLEVDLVTKWSANCSTVVAVGDGAQALYTWRGAEPDAFLGVGDDDKRRVLAQSHRVPIAAHRLATRFARKLLAGVEYRPTGREGSVREGGLPIRYGEGVAEMAERHLGDPEMADLAAEDPARGGLMIQASCSYMLRPAIKALRERGIPFHNPMRVARADWNPLGERKGTSTVDRLLAFLTDDQTSRTAALWLPMLRASGVLAKGAKERIKDGLPEDGEAILDLFVSRDVAGRAFSGDPEWLIEHVTGEFKQRLEYPFRVLRKRGDGALRERPRVQVGTIHSFKGGQAGSVILSPDLSPAAFSEWVDGKPSVRRTFYVAMTRTMDRLTILPPSSRRSVDLRS